MFRSYLAILIVGFAILYAMSSIVGCCMKKEKYESVIIKYYNIKGSNICYFTIKNRYGFSDLPCDLIPPTENIDTVIDSN